ncbi:MAG TPA: hypothetical protein VEY09_01305 [Pyrinomonadaceae bacterium]|nr:hypothetical protein [Pyrinomonadaceae bacterium]
MTLGLALLALAVNLQGCGSGSGPRGRAQESRASAERTAAKAPPEVKVYVDEALLQKSFAVLNGTVENSGDERLERLSVEVELRHRRDGHKEMREVAVVPEVLAPGEKGTYTLKVKSEEWGGFRVVKLRSRGGAGEVAFQSLPGKERPPERVETTRTITDEAPRRRQGGSDDFINTPDTPISVP